MQENVTGREPTETFLKSNGEKNNNHHHQINKQREGGTRPKSGEVLGKEVFQGRFHVSKMFRMSRHLMLLKD